MDPAPPSAQPSRHLDRSDFLLSMVIPCFNEQEALPELFRRVTAAADTLGCRWRGWFPPGCCRIQAIF